MNGALNNRRIVRVRSYKTQADQEHEHQVEHKKPKMIPQPGVSLMSLNLKNISQKTAKSDGKYEKSCDHDVVLFPTVVSGGAISGGVLPVNFAIIASVSCCLSLGR